MKKSTNTANVFKLAIHILLKASAKYFFLIMFISVAVALPDVINLLVWKNIIDEIGKAVESGNVYLEAVIFLFFLHFMLVALKLMLGKINSYLKEIYMVLIDQYITNETVEVIDQLELSEVENPQLHNDLKKISDESTARSIGILNNIVDIIKNFTVVLGTISLLASFQAVIIVIIILSILPATIINQKSMKKLFEVYDSRFEKVRYYTYLKNMIVRYENFKEIKLFSNIRYIQDKINNIFERIISQDKSVKKTLTIKSAFGELVELILTYLCKIMIVVVGINNKVSMGSILMSIESANKLQNSFTNLISLVLTLYENCLYLISFDRLHKTSEQKKREESKIELKKDFNIETIELRDVYFKYPSHSKYTLEHISFLFEKGNNYALVGYNGSGKTTLIKLILGLYAPTRGEILINGINLKEYDLKAYFKKASAVFQDFVKYPFTVKENIGISNSKEINCIDHIMKAATLGQAHDFIERLTHKYETNLLIGWEGSEDISTGQWQRIAISRGFMRDAEIMVFDEPTASLDARTENMIFETMEKKEKSMINIIITHRFINIKEIDKIVILDKGKINGIGNHSSLIRENSLYAELYRIQSKMYDAQIDENEVVV